MVICYSSSALPPSTDTLPSLDLPPHSNPILSLISLHEETLQIWRREKNHKREKGKGESRKREKRVRVKAKL